MSAYNPAIWARLWRNRAGSVLTEFALVLPAVLAICLGTVEFLLLGFDYIRAGEATRRGARDAAIVAPPVNISATATLGTVITCTGASVAAVHCNGATATSTTLFTALVTDMQAILPRITPANIQVVYSYSGIGDIMTPGGIKPFVAVNLVNMQYNLVLGSFIPGLGATIPMPSFSTKQLANSYPFAGP